MKFYTNFFVRGDSVHVRGYDNHKRFVERIPYRPTLYVPSRKKTKYSTVFGESVDSIEFGSISDAKEFINKYDDVEGFKIYGSTLFGYTCLNENYTDQFNPEIVKIAYLDIEVASEDGFPEPELANQPVIAITVYVNGTYNVFGCGDYSHYRDDVTYSKSKDERSLLERFLDFWQASDPDIVTGWNVNLFDISYLHNRIKKVLGDKEVKRLSPTGFIGERKFTLNNREQTEYELIGISTLDYIDLYKKFTYTQQESYRLDHIAFVELGERKLDYSEVETLHQLYKTDYKKFIDYNIRDVELVHKLEDKMKLIDQALVIAYDAKVNFVDVFTQVRMWDVLIHNYLYDKNIVVPPKTNNQKSSQFAGAYVKEPVPGMYKWIMSFDLDSLYPHLIMQYNISPETFVEGEYQDVTVDKILEGKFETRDDLCLTPGGYYFAKDRQGFLAEMMEKMYNDRVKYKKKMLEAKAELEEVNRKLKEMA
jgi:DNA polymerase elongation subunit (family B)